MFQYSGFLDLYALQLQLPLQQLLQMVSLHRQMLLFFKGIGIEFYQKVGSNYYLFATGNCLKIEDAF